MVYFVLALPVHLSIQKLYHWRLQLEWWIWFQEARATKGPDAVRL